MVITTQQIKQLQTICSGKFRSRDERLETVSDIVGDEINSFTELSQVQASDLIYFFNTGTLPDNSSWGRFNKSNGRHMTILSRCHTLGWVDERTGYADLNRLGAWLKSNRSPVRKPLLEMNAKEQSKVIGALDGMIGKRYSSPSRKFSSPSRGGGLKGR